MCRIDGCDGPVRNKAQQLCNTHYLRLRRHGDPTTQLIQRYAPDQKCGHEGCSASPFAKGLCRPHYEQSRRPTPLPDPTPEQRFWAKVDRTPTCWLWTGALTKGASGEGYGQFKVDGRQITAHRFAWELRVGPIPDGLTIDHLCRVRRCVRPAHMATVTMRENVLRGLSPVAMHARQTHCKRGHPLSGDNLRMTNGGRSRRCLACKRLAYHAKK